LSIRRIAAGASQDASAPFSKKTLAMKKLVWPKDLLDWNDVDPKFVYRGVAPCLENDLYAGWYFIEKPSWYKQHHGWHSQSQLCAGMIPKMTEVRNWYKRLEARPLPYYTRIEILNLDVPRMQFNQLESGYSFRLAKYDGQGYLLVNATKVDDLTYLDEETKTYHSAQYAISVLGWEVYGPFLNKMEKREEDLVLG
jgi:hypothetical protein